MDYWSLRTRENWAIKNPLFEMLDRYWSVWRRWAHSGENEDGCEFRTTIANSQKVSCDDKLIKIDENTEKKKKKHFPLGQEALYDGLDYMSLVPKKKKKLGTKIFKI